VNSQSPKDVVKVTDKTLYDLIRDILFYSDNIDEDTDERIDKRREWNCLYEYFLGVVSNRLNL
jgi:hypothetical protein|tara:strand:- start:1917 stop:2105 length:189 start_codon:yes stop_codon:yes gene_type:complete